jgi:hypothetical protein
MRMSWEALRLTSKSPTETYTILGPHAVEELLRDARNAVWREYPEDQRDVRHARQKLIDVFDRNMKVWKSIKKPAPEAFFKDLPPFPADGHVRQALVLAWMMMPRAGGRKFADSGKIVQQIFDRLLGAWQEDERTFTKGPAAKSATKARPKKKPKGKRK